MDIIASHRSGLLDALREEAEDLAGRTGDFAQRAATYHHLYQHSGGNHAFPLLAAHGALWGSKHFRAGMRLGGWLKWRFPSARRRDAIDALARFTETLRDINRQVCVETYFIYRLSAVPALRPEAERLIEPSLLAGLDRMHGHRRAGTLAPLAERRALFELFYDWEQRTVVHARLTEAFAAFDWPELERLARRTNVRFAYLGWRPLRFSDFASREERREKGLLAFDRAERRGWAAVERSLKAYGLMPPPFTANSAQHFFAIQNAHAERRRRVRRELLGVSAEEAVTLADAA